jgi:hypothetical protein
MISSHLGEMADIDEISSSFHYPRFWYNFEDELVG